MTPHDVCHAVLRVAEKSHGDGSKSPLGEQRWLACRPGGRACGARACGARARVALGVPRTHEWFAAHAERAPGGVAGRRARAPRARAHCEGRRREPAQRLVRVATHAAKALPRTGGVHRVVSGDVHDAPRPQGDCSSAVVGLWRDRHNLATSRRVSLSTVCQKLLATALNYTLEELARQVVHASHLVFVHSRRVCEENIMWTLFAMESAHLGGALLGPRCSTSLLPSRASPGKGCGLSSLSWASPFGRSARFAASWPIPMRRCTSTSLYTQARLQAGFVRGAQPRGRYGRCCVALRPPFCAGSQRLSLPHVPPSLASPTTSRPRLFRLGDGLRRLLPFFPVASVATGLQLNYIKCAVVASGALLSSIAPRLPGGVTGLGVGSGYLLGGPRWARVRRHRLGQADG